MANWRMNQEVNPSIINLSQIELIIELSIVTDTLRYPQKSFNKYEKFKLIKKSSLPYIFRGSTFHAREKKALNEE